MSTLTRSAHDMGGVAGRGAVGPEIDEPVFHAAWERRTMALTVAMGATGAWNIDASRAARESLPAAQYLASSYYAIWLAGLERLLVERGLATRDELAAGHALRAGKPVARVLRAESVAAALAAGSPTSRDARSQPRYAVGQRVRARTLRRRGHTRLPRYVQGRVGEIVALRGVHVYPDRHANGGPPFDEAPEWLYTVRFDGAALWGEDAETGLSVSVDAWEPYLEPEAAR